MGRAGVLIRTVVYIDDLYDLGTKREVKYSERRDQCWFVSGMIIVCSDFGKSLTRNGKLYTFPELFTNFHAVTAMARCSLTFNWTHHDCRDHLQKPLRKSNRWIIPFLCQPSVELVYNICVHVALVDRHDAQIRTNLSRVPLACLTCTII